MIAAGKHKARAVEGALVEVGDKQTPAVSVIFEIIDGDAAGDRIKWDGWLTEKTADRTMESLRYCGWNTDMLDDLAGVTDNEVSLTIEPEVNERDGKTYARVKWVNRVGGGASINDMQRVAGASAKALAQRFAAAARGSRDAVKKPQAPQGGAGRSWESRAPSRGRPSQDEPSPFEPDDVPF